MRTIKLDTSELRACGKCGKTSAPLYRHHKGFDSLLGRYNKGIGFNYNKWLDCVPLCLTHHCEIHFIYEDYLENWVNRTPRGASYFRKKLIKVCDEWLAGTIGSPRIPAGYRHKFESSLSKWRRERNG